MHIHAYKITLAVPKHMHLNSDTLTHELLIKYARIPQMILSVSLLFKTKLIHNTRKRNDVQTFHIPAQDILILLFHSCI